MSLASVHLNTGLIHHSRSVGSISSLDDLHGSYYSTASEAVLSIEELKHQLNSCFTCGVSWHEDHVSLDCAECGGYSLERPCPVCDGQCSSVWKRDLTMSHEFRKARWEGECRLLQKTQVTNEDSKSRMCKPLEKLTVSS